MVVSDNKSTFRNSVFQYENFEVFFSYKKSISYVKLKKKMCFTIICNQNVTFAINEYKTKKNNPKSFLNNEFISK